MTGSDDELVGRVLGERFTLERKIGAGGMGAVYQARDAASGTLVAVKVVKRELFEDAEAKARFAREAEAMQRLDHPCVVKFLGTGETGELRYIAMELLEGRTLKSRIATRGAMPWRETLPILRDVVRALQAAHEAGLIHRDLKPENIFLVDAMGNADAAPVKLLDFGVARHTQMPAGQTMTATGVVLGTPGFVAPEVVLKGASNDPRSDFYGLGATWFEMLTGEKPFSAETPFALVMLHVSSPTPRPSAVRAGLTFPARAESLLHSMLAKTAEQRPASASVLLDELAVLEQISDGSSVIEEPASSLRNRFLPFVSSDETPHTRPVARLGDLSPLDATAAAGFTTSLPAAATRTAKRPAVLLAFGAVVVVLLLVGVIAAQGLGLAKSPPAPDARSPAVAVDAPVTPPASLPAAIAPAIVAPAVAVPNVVEPAVPPVVVEPARVASPPASVKPPGKRQRAEQPTHKPELLPLDQAPTPHG